MEIYSLKSQNRILKDSKTEKNAETASQKIGDELLLQA